MEKKTLTSILQCPIDFLYLWASDEFIAQLGNKAKIIRAKKYNQYQTLWKTMIDNVDAGSSAEYQEVYQSWLKQIEKAIQDTYGMAPATILRKLAMGESVVGKNWSKGVYGIGANVTTGFVQNSAVTVDAETGKILVNGAEAAGQTPIIGDGGAITGYSYYDAAGNRQYQSGVTADGTYGAVCYSSPDGVERATGGNFDPSEGGFWQNANNYMPLVNKIIEWLMSLFSKEDRVVLTTDNTVPSQTEWVEPESDGNGGLIAGGLALAGIALLTMEKPGKKKKTKK